jgi:hypothetical protein
MRAIAAGQRFYRKVVVVAALFALLLAASMLGLFG